MVLKKVYSKLFGEKVSVFSVVAGVNGVNFSHFHHFSYAAWHKAFLKKRLSAFFWIKVHDQSDDKKIDSLARFFDISEIPQEMAPNILYDFTISVLLDVCSRCKFKWWPTGMLYKEQLVLFVKFSVNQLQVCTNFSICWNGYHCGRAIYCLNSCTSFIIWRCIL